MSDLHGRLDRASASYRVPPDAWEALQTRSRSRRRARRVATIMTALIVGVGAIAIVLTAFSPSGKAPVAPAVSASAKPPEISTLDADAVRTLPLSPFPEGIAAGDGNVWAVAGTGDGTGRADVVRLDPRTGEVVARISNVPVPGWEFGGGGIATGAGSAWVVGSVNRGVVLTQIDPATNAVVDTISLGPGYEADVWADATGIWVLNFASGGRSMEVVRVDPATHAVVARIPVPATWSQVIFASGGSIWVQGTSPGETGGVKVNTLYRIDPSSNELVDTIDIGQQAGLGFAADQSGVWASVPGGVQRFDTTTGSFVGSVIEIHALSMISDGSGGAWFRVGPDTTHTTAFVHVDASGVIDRRVDVPPEVDQVVAATAYTFDPSTGALWVVHYKDSVSRVDLAGYSQPQGQPRVPTGAIPLPVLPSQGLVAQGSNGVAFLTMDGRTLVKLDGLTIANVNAPPGSVILEATHGSGRQGFYALSLSTHSLVPAARPVLPHPNVHLSDPAGVGPGGGHWARRGQLPQWRSKKLDYLVIGDADFVAFADGWMTGKLTKAMDLIAEGEPIEVIPERHFLELLYSDGESVSAPAS